MSRNSENGPHSRSLHVVNAHFKKFQLNITSTLSIESGRASYHRNKQNYGIERLKKAIAYKQDATADEIVKVIRQDVLNWMGSAAPIDDFTLLVMEVLES